MTEVRRRRARGQLPEVKPSPEIGSIITLPGNALSIVVFGRPAPQGSKNPTGQEANPRTRPWRDMILKVCEAELPKDWVLLDGPLDVEMWFYFAPPASAPKGSLPYTKTTYDWDKLARALGDGLTQGGVITDDARIVDGHVYKRYIWDRTQPRAVAVVSHHRNG